MVAFVAGAKAAKALHPTLDTQMVDSVHTGHHPYYWGGGAAGLARGLFDSEPLKGFNLGAANTETNAKKQNQDRAIMEGGDLNDWFNVADVVDRLCVTAASTPMAASARGRQRSAHQRFPLARLPRHTAPRACWGGRAAMTSCAALRCLIVWCRHMRCASFCMAQGDNYDEIGFTQGLASFLPNTTFLQPPGWVHAMVASTFQPNGLAVNLTSAPGEQAASAHHTTSFCQRPWTRACPSPLLRVSC